MPFIIICVEIIHSGNLGAIARLCDNYDIDQLILVNPQCDINKEAFDRATHGKRFLDEPIIVSTLEEAKSHVDLMVALSARKGGSQSLARSSLAIHQLPSMIDGVSRTGLVFGRENSGLTNLETDLCDFLVYIPLPGSNAVLNISHAVAVTLWELIREEEPENGHRLMSRAEKDAFMMMLNAILPHSWIKQNSYYGIQRVYSSILGRSQVTTREANTLIGFLRSILRSLEGPHPPWDAHE